jgi:hypothetical protein
MWQMIHVGTAKSAGWSPKHHKDQGWSYMVAALALALAARVVEGLVVLARAGLAMGGLEVVGLKDLAGLVGEAEAMVARATAMVAAGTGVE